MRDPSAPAHERYKATGVGAGLFFLDGKPVSKHVARALELKRMNLGGAAEIAENLTSQAGVVAAVSPDGLTWKHLHEPIMRPPWLLDTQNILAYDPDIQKYLMYLRSGRARRRAVSRYEAMDFRGPWGNHLMVLTVEPDDPPDWDIYQPCYCRHPHGPHLMFFTPYPRASDWMEVHLAISYDGMTWYRPQRSKPVVGKSHKYGQFYPAPEFVSLDDDTWGILMLASQYPHNSFTTSGAPQTHQADHKPQEYIWATWKRNRLVALQADDYGEFALTERVCAGQQLRMNFTSHLPGGFIKVEIVDGQMPNRASAALPQALPGYSFEDCDPLSGDELDAIVSWKGKSDLSQLRNKRMHLRFRMARAKLFAATV
jgi:hypothetical protein